MTAPPQTESVIQAEILRTFGRIPSLRLWRQYTGSAVPIWARQSLIGDSVSIHTIAQLPRIKFSIPGAADITGILPDGRRLEIEVKSATGKQSKQQEKFEAMITKLGGVYVLARSEEDVWNGLREAGYENLQC